MEMTTPTSIRGFGRWGDQGRGRALSAGRADPDLYGHPTSRIGPKSQLQRTRLPSSSRFVLITHPWMLSFAIAFALRGARKLVRGFREELTEEERYRVADDVVHQLKQHGDPWRLSEELPPPRQRALEPVSRRKKPRRARERRRGFLFVQAGRPIRPIKTLKRNLYLEG